jgi:hypothetical protein
MNLIFANPAWLALSAFALAPIIIHFLYKRRIKTIKWPSIIFLSEAQRENSRRLRLRELLLLLFRVLLILAAVFAIARPVLAPRGTDPSLAMSGAASDGRSIILVIDNSLSMGLSDNAVTLLEESILKASELLSAVHRPGDAIAVLPSCGSEAAYSETYSLEAARMSLDKIEPSLVSGSVLEALRTAETFASAKDRRIYIFSDFQRSVFSNLRYTPPAGTAPPILVDLSRNGRFNAVVANVRLPSVFQGLGQGGDLVATIRNTGDTAWTVTADLFDGGRKTGQSSVELGPGASRDIVFPWRPARGGISLGRITLDGDQLKADNTRWFIDPAPDRLHVVVVDDAGASGFLKKAFEASEQRDYLDVSFVRSSELAGRLDRSDLVILCSIRSWPEGTTERLKTFLSRGNSLLIAMEKDTDIDEFNRALVPDIIPCRVLSRSLTAEDGTNAKFSVRQADFSHPLLSYFQETDLFRFARFTGYFRTDPALSDPNLLVLARMNTGAPALVSYLPRHGRTEREAGQVLLFCSSLSDSMNDLPYRPNFPPFILQMIRFLTDRTFPSFPSGTPLAAIALKTGFPESTAVTRLSPVPSAGAQDAENPLVTTGAYKAGDQYFTVVSPPEESETSGMSEKELEAVFGRHETIRRGESVTGRAVEINAGRSLSFWFVLTALAFAAAEMLVAWSLADRSPPGQTPSVSRT